MEYYGKIKFETFNLRIRDFPLSYCRIFILKSPIKNISLFSNASVSRRVWRYKLVNSVVSIQGCEEIQPIYNQIYIFVF